MCYCAEEDLKSTVFSTEKIASLRGRVAKCVGVSVALPPSESVHAIQKLQFAVEWTLFFVLLCRRRFEKHGMLLAFFIENAIIYIKLLVTIKES